MDEIENVRLMKKLLKVFGIFLLPIIGLISIMTKEDSILNNIFIFLIYMLGIIEIWILIILIPKIICVCIFKLQNFLKPQMNISKNKEYVRDIEIKYSPAIISLILDLHISYYKDYTATILYLCYRKYLEIFTENNEIKFKILEEDERDLNPHEQYVYRCIKGSAFDEDKFMKLIIEDAVNLQLISTTNEKIERTSKGEKEATLWKGFKNYIHDYTLISDKDIKHMEILHEYIPYAIALDEANSIEKFIAQNENYRNLIYRFSNRRKT